MWNKNRVRVALTTAVVVLGVAAAGTGVAFATPATAPPPAAAVQPPPGDGGGQPPDNNALIKQMDQMMQRMVQNLPADQRDAATRMHQQMRPTMARMMAGDMGAMGQMNSGHGPGGMNGSMGG